MKKYLKIYISLVTFIFLYFLPPSPNSLMVLSLIINSPFCKSAMADLMSWNSLPDTPKRSFTTPSAIVCYFMMSGYCALA